MPLPWEAAAPLVGLAPMAGVTDAATRVLCFEQGAAWAVSEMLSAKGWVFSGRKNRNAAELLTRFPGEGATGLQLFGREPEYVARAAKELEGEGFAFIDLNFGCPAPKIVGNGEGSALMREPKLLGEVVRAAVRATKLPVTAKIRAGWDASSVNAAEVARICECEGARAVAVHARTRDQFYAGHADWRVIAEVVRAVAIPVLGNGDVRHGRGCQTHVGRNRLRARDGRPRRAGKSVGVCGDPRRPRGQAVDAAHPAGAHAHRPAPPGYGAQALRRTKGRIGNAQNTWPGTSPACPARRACASASTP